MGLEIKGKITQILGIEQPTDTFKKRHFVIEVQSGNYKNIVALQFVQDNVTKLDNYAIGQEVKVHFDVRSREWNGKFFTELTAYNMSRVADIPEEMPTPPQTEWKTPLQGATPPAAGAGTVDDLPF